MTKPINPPPSIANQLSEFDKNRREWGEPNLLGKEFSKDTIERACDEFPAHRVVGIFSRFCNDQSAMHRLWPVTALALSNYAFQSRERAKMPGASPTAVRKLLKSIDKGSEKLARDLAELYSLGNGLSTPRKPEVQGHIRWLTDYLSRAFTGQRLDQDLDDKLESWYEREIGRTDFMMQLAILSASANAAQDRIQAELLARPKGQSQPQLYDFVKRTGEIWTALSLRQPTVRQAGNDEPDYSVFVRNLAGLVGEHPTRAMIKTAFLNQRRG